MGEVTAAARVTERYPGVSVLTELAEVGDTEALGKAAELGWQALYERWHDAGEEELLAAPNVQAYRGLCELLGLDPDKNPPSIQALVNRGLRGRPPGSWPRVNPVVDAVNVVAVRTLTSLGAFDADRVTGEVRLDLTAGGEPFHALGAKRVTPLEPDQLVLRDQERVLSLFSRRDGVHQAIRPDTRRVLLLGCVVRGVAAGEVAAAVGDAARLLAGAGGQA
jgi:DNA/RNA-binding domain of Phe-tRNA-synthetase-like protein